MEVNIYGCDEIKDEGLKAYFLLTGAGAVLSLSGNDKDSARVMLYFDKEYENKKTAYIGMPFASDKSDFIRLFTEAEKYLKDNGYEYIVAPIDGSTWFKYRFVSFDSLCEPFPMEPVNEPWVHSVMLELGYAPIHNYRSDISDISAVKILDGIDGLAIRDFDMEDVDNEIKILYDISIESFGDNFLYEEIPFRQFYTLYKSMLSKVDRELLCIAEYKGEPAGFLFALQAGDTVIMKTIAVLPKFQGLRIGSKLYNHVAARASAKGCKKAIAALISEENNSKKIPKKYSSEKIRGYSLYGKNLGE